MKSEDWIDPNDGKMDVDEYFQLLVTEFPVLKDEIEEESGLAHFQMECFARYTIEVIKASNYEELKRCFQFQESKIDLMNSDLENALAVSFCESMLLGEVRLQMPQIVSLMPPMLKQKYVEYEAYYNSLGSGK